MALHLVSQEKIVRWVIQLDVAVSNTKIDKESYMLILTRRSNERIFIGEDVVLVVLGIENNRVKLGIEAPSEIAILREEIVDDSKKSKFDANSQSDNDNYNDLDSKAG